MTAMQETVLENNALRGAERARPVLTLEDIWRGIEADEFFPYFQPKIRLHGMELAGVEALMRWRHPAHGVLTAGAFLPLVADNFLFEDLAFHMLEKSVAQCRNWQDQGIDVPVSVNLSPDLLLDPQLPERIEAKLREQALANDRLIIEIPESAVANSSAQALDGLIQLRVKGFQLAIDDYGTGHCERAQIERIPASELKIDRMMLAGAARGPKLKALLRQSVDIARELNLAAVAEGVESQEEWDLVNELGCDLAQGYFIARPMAGEELVGWLPVWTSDPFV